MLAPMRVLAVSNMYPPHHLGGYELCCRGAMHELRREGHEARVLTTDYRHPGVDPTLEEDPNVHRELRWYWHDHEWLELGVLERLQLERHNAEVFDRHLRDLKPDIVTWWAVGGMSLGLLERGRRAGVPALLFVHDYWPSYGPQHDLWTRAWRSRPRAAAVVERLTGLPTRPALEKTGRWLFNSRSMRDETLATGLRIPDVAILAPGIERAYLQQKREQHTPAWCWRLLYLGRVVAQKGIRTLVQSMTLLPEQATLRIVGEGDESYGRELEDTVTELGLGERVRFEPSRGREELFEIYRAADVLVFPVEWQEPFGLVPLEAMAMGRPVVATGRGGSGDYLVDRENSLLFEAGDAIGLANAVALLAEDEDLRERLRVRGLRTAAEHSEEHFNREAVREMAAVLERSAAPRT